MKILPAMTRRALSQHIIARNEAGHYSWLSASHPDELCSKMGGFGSGRSGGGPSGESAFPIDVDALRRDGMIRLGVRAGCVIRFSGPYYDLEVECETPFGQRIETVARKETVAGLPKRLSWDGG